MSEPHLGKKLVLGAKVLVALAVLTGLEVWIAATLRGSLPYLAVIAVVKVGLIMEYFMHLSQLRQTEEHR